MRLKSCPYIVLLFLIVCFSACSNKTNSKKSELHISLIDSTNHSARLVSVQIFNAHSNYFAYVAGETKSTEVYTINEQGKLDFLEQHQVASKAGGIRALTNVKINDSNLLILGNKADNSIEVYRIENNGKLEKINSVFDTDSTFIDETVTIHDITINNRTFIYAGGLDKGLSCFELSENGALRPIQSIEDNDTLFLHGIIGMSSLVIDNKTFLITGAFFDGGISCFQIMENGHLKNVSNLKDDKNMFLNGTFPVNTVQLGDQNFLLVGHRHKIHYSVDNAEEDYHGDGINVFKVDAQGQIKLHSLLKDNEELLLKGSTRIEILKSDENSAFVFIGTRDDKGIQICSLQQDGILKPIKTIDLGYSIYNGMTLKNMYDNWYLLVGSYDKNKLEMYSIK
ncbi:hypothetical protein [Labilibaculum antarcticum]|uniref:Stress protein n=1 Tax=Labilibaculum antarcticum TaxID=1717717 RepID=A0A1Y1CR67_9BACT|nr:hypothetical protein [Labilibaculum antarcticum]BAX81741.1 stress protein [Labilibaculum antarcticum]